MSSSPTTGGPSRDLSGARDAYAKKDVNASKLYHSLKKTTASTAGAEGGHQIGEDIALKHNLLQLGLRWYPLSMPSAVRGV